MSKYTEDKERIDKITEIIANKEPMKEWVALYWIAVAIGHILEWMVKQPVNATPDPDQAANDLPEKKERKV